jgi:hypothetical protein
MSNNQKAQERRFRARLVRRAIETDAGLLASWFHRYAEAEGRDWKSLATELGCELETLDQVALCVPPRPERFAADAQEIAEAFGVNPSRLLALLRRLEVLDALSAPPAEIAASAPAGEPYLLAARDREPEQVKEALPDYPPAPPNVAPSEPEKPE